MNEFEHFPFLWMNCSDAETTGSNRTAQLTTAQYSNNNAMTATHTQHTHIHRHIQPNWRSLARRRMICSHIHNHRCRQYGQMSARMLCQNCIECVRILSGTVVVRQYDAATRYSVRDVLSALVWITAAHVNIALFRLKIGFCRGFCLERERKKYYPSNWANGGKHRRKIEIGIKSNKPLFCSVIRVILCVVCTSSRYDKLVVALTTSYPVALFIEGNMFDVFSHSFFLTLFLSPSLMFIRTSTSIVISMVQTHT